MIKEDELKTFEERKLFQACKYGSGVKVEGNTLNELATNTIKALIVQNTEKERLLKSDRSEIIICHVCKGRGYTEHEELIDYHNRDYDTYTNLCYRCEGSGRLIRYTRSDYEKAYKEDKDL